MDSPANDTRPADLTAAVAGARLAGAAARAAAGACGRPDATAPALAGLVEAVDTDRVLAGVGRRRWGDLAAGGRLALPFAVTPGRVTALLLVPVWAGEPACYRLVRPYGQKRAVGLWGLPAVGAGRVFVVGDPLTGLALQLRHARGSLTPLPVVSPVPNLVPGVRQAPDPGWVYLKDRPVTVLVAGPDDPMAREALAALPHADAVGWDGDPAGGLSPLALLAELADRARRPAPPPAGDPWELDGVEPGRRAAPNPTRPSLVVEERPDGWWRLRGDAPATRVWQTPFRLDRRVVGPAGAVVHGRLLPAGRPAVPFTVPERRLDRRPWSTLGGLCAAAGLPGADADRSLCPVACARALHPPAVLTLAAG